MSVATTTETPPITGSHPLFGAAALRRADRLTMERYELPGVILMERASLEAARVVTQAFPDRRAALVVCGSGNNGGDGYAVARHLADAGWDVQIATARGATPRTVDATMMATIAKRLGLRPRTFVPEMLQSDRVVIDALLGIGASGAPRGAVAAVIEAIAGHHGGVVALDVPSGVDADTGVVTGASVRADLTVTFHGDKPGLHIEPGRSHAGSVTVVDIGVPAGLTARPSAWLAGPDAAGVPHKRGRGDKYAAGAVLVVAGSAGMGGAAVLCARSTLRAGAGLTLGIVPATVHAILAEAAPEVMTPISGGDPEMFTAADVDGVVAQSGRVASVALGPGLGRHRSTTPFVQTLIRRLERPLVIDADGLWHLADRPTVLARRTWPTVITPHTGEAARLLGVDRAFVDANRLESAWRLAKSSRAVVVLKGPGTIVCGADGTVVVDRVGTPALATAGSGDVLTGIVAALLARGLPALEAAATAVVVHGRAGRLAGNGSGTIAGDLVEQLPMALEAA